MKAKFLLLLLICLQYGAKAQSKLTYTDSRDKQQYTYVEYENINTSNGKPKIWMSQNLNFKVDSGNFEYPFPDNEGSRKTHGLLYTWQAATKACPPGWHLPTAAEWQELVDTFGGNEIAGRPLKSGKGWVHDGNGENWSGFNASPSGYYEVDDQTYSVYYSGLGQWWTATAVEKDSASIRIMSSITDKVLLHNKPKANGYAVRCVKD